MSILPKQPADMTPQEKRALLAHLLQKKAGGARSFPLSYAQQRLWFLDRMNPGAPVYNVPLAVRLTGPLNVGGLEQSLQAVVRRHDTLRTTFAEGKEETPVQIVVPTATPPLPVIDLQPTPMEGREGEFKRLAVEEARRPFDLGRGPLVRAMLLRLGDADHVLLLTLHHIVSDGWSLGVLLRDVIAFYEAFAARKEPSLPELPIQYADYAVWQRQWLRGEELEKQLNYWRHRLDGAVPTLDLPTDRPRPAVQSFRGALFPFELSADLVDALRALAKQEDCTLYMVLLAAFQTLLHRYSGQDDLCVGTPIAGRGRAETEGLVGFFVNTLVLRTELSGDPTFRALLGRVRETALGAYAHQDLPFERLVEALKVDRDLSRPPLFQVLFVLHNSPFPAFEFGGLKVSQWDVDGGTSKFDLSLFLLEQERGLRGTLEYSTDLFDAATAERLAGHYRTLLEAAAADPDAPLSRLPLLTPQEQGQLDRFNDTSVEFAEEHFLHRLIERQADRTPDACAVSFEGRELTYRELDRRASALAGRLRALGVGPDVPVGVCMERSPELVVALLGVLKAGGAYLPLDPDYPAERLGFMLQDAAPPVVLTHGNLGEGLPDYGGRILRLDHGNAEADGECAGGPALAPDHLAYVIYTSGSTGRPKGALNSHRAICNRLLWMQQEYRLTAADRVLQKTPFSFDVSVWEFFWPLLAGARIVLARPGGHKDPAYLAHLIQEQRVSVCHFVPSMLRAFLTEPGLEASCATLRDVFCSGEALPHELQQRFFGLLPCRLHNLYGPTEAAVDVTYWECRREDPRPAVPIGRPVANTRMHVLDAALRPLPVGVPGELYIGGVQLARGYLNRPELTAERFLEAPGLGRLYRTGDRGRWLADGALEYLGRTDHQVKVRGVRIELGEVEAALAACPDVAEAAAAVRQTDDGDARLVGYVVPDFRARPSADGDGRRSDQVAQWRAVWEETYGRGGGREAAFDTSGWDSSYTGLPIPEEDMREWRDRTVERILALRPSRVLEVGCGSGLLLFAVAPHCRSYTGLDFSEQTIRKLREQLAAPERRFPQVNLVHRAAHELEGLGAAGFDAVVINSVVQYFPGVDYLVSVVEGAARAVRPGGRIFLGDLRNFRLLAAFHASVQLHKAPATLTRAQFLARVRNHVRQERELLVDPAFFDALRGPIPRIRRAEIQLKRGRRLNEMTRFRYDVVLFLDEEPGSAGNAADARDWQDQSLSAPAVRRLLEETPPDSLSLLRVPNARLWSEMKTLELLADPNGPETVSDLREAVREIAAGAVDPEEFWALGQDLGYDVSIGWSERGGDACYDVHFRRPGPAAHANGAVRSVTEADPPWPWETYANDPLKGKAVQNLAQQLRDALRKKLPEPMIPSAFVVLDALPLSPNGKVDRKALPAPEQTRPELDEAYVAPRTPLEQALADLWADILGLERVGVRDNFFELGGHSLLATQVISRMRKVAQVELPLRALFEAPTVAELAERVEEVRRAALGLPAAPLRPIPREGELPLSFGQETFWFLDQLEPGSPVFNIDVAVRLQGPLDAAAAEQAIQEVLRRHEVLRTIFAAVEGRPFAVFSSPAPFTLPILDLSSLPIAEREEEARRLADEDSRRPFDLTRGPLFRVRLLRLGSEDHVGLLTVHHSVYDGWSQGVFLREVGLLYQAFGAGRPSPLPETSVQYADFAHWQRQWLKSGLMEEQLAYWKKQLAGPLPVLELPTDHPRPAARTFHGARRLMVLSPTLTAAVHALSRREGCTLYMVLLAAFQALLHRYTGREDLCVGTPIAGRNRAETEGLIGFFVNTLVLRADLSGNPTFRALLARARETALAAYAHQDLPFEMLVQTLRPSRDLSHSSLFQVMFILQNAPLKIPSIAGLSSRPLVKLADNGTSKFDLTLTMMEGTDGLTGTVEYNTDLFEEPTIGRLLGHYQTILEAVVADPDLDLARLPLLTQAERRQLAEWNRTGAEYPAGECIHELFEAQAARTPNAEAVVCGDLRLTYGELNRRANRLARHLRDLGVGPEGLVGLYIERSPDLLVGLLAVLKGGGAYVPLDPEYPSERVAAIVEDAGLRRILTRRDLADDLPSDGARLLWVDEETQGTGPEDEENLCRSAKADNLAYVIYTSGSTGRPKGVMLTHAGLCNAYRAWEDAYHLRSEATSHLQMASCAFDVFTGDWTRALCSGGKLVLCPRDVLLDAPKLYDLMLRERVDCAEFVPAVLRNLVGHLETTGQSLSFMRLLVAGSDVWYAGEYRRIRGLCGPQTRLINSYGLTEATIDSTYFESAALDLPEDRPVPIGRPFANSRVHILDRNLQPVPAGVPGELFVGGPGVARGYFHDPDLTAEKFIADPFAPSPPAPLPRGERGEERGARLFRTGDLARWLPDGCVELLGRADDQVKIRGYRIEPGEIESVLGRHDAVRQAVVVCRGDAPDRKHLVAFVTSNGPAPTAQELRAYLKDRLPEYMVPSAFVVLDSLPLTPNGKVDRKALPAVEATPAELRTDFIAPRNPVEEKVAQVWADVLGVGRVGVLDNFFELGGHSLLATQVISRLGQAFEVELPLRRLFEAPTVAGLAEVIEAARLAGGAGRLPPLVPAQRDEPPPLSFAQQRLWFLDQFEPNSPFYNIPAAARFTGALDPAALGRSLQELVRRHETLRTTFRTADGRPVQVVAPTLDLPLPVTDLTHLPESEREAEARHFAREEARRPFDLTRGPLLRVALLKLAPGEYVVILVVHHIIADGWSMRVFFRDLAAFYQKFAAGTPSRLPDLPVQYADYACWQRRWLQGEVLDKQLAYWKGRLAGAPALEMPTDRPRPPMQGVEGATQPLTLPPDLAARLKALARRENCTPYMVLLAAFQTLLHRYSGQDDVSVGTPVAGRRLPQAEGLIGFFVNTLVLRLDLSGDPSFRQLLGRVREVTLGAYAHQDLPFEMLVEALRPQRDLSRTPLFQTMFIFLNAPVETAELPGLSLTPVDADSGTAKFDLSLAFTESEKGLVGSLEYSTDLFDAGTAERLAGHYRTLLEAAAADPDAPLSRLPLLTAQEQGQLDCFNDTRVEFAEEHLLHRLIELQAGRTPDACAVSFEGRELSYGELDRRASALARRLCALGVGPDAPVGVCMERSPELVVALLGVLKAGGAYLPLDPDYPTERLALMLKDAAPPAVLAQRRLAGHLPADTARVILLDDGGDLGDGGEDLCESGPQSGPDHLSYVIYTSGSTGVPKGAMNSHRAICNRLLWMQREYRLTPQDRVLQKTPFSFDVSVWEFFWPLLAGARIVLARPGGHKDPSYLAELIREEKVSVCHFVPSMLRAFLAEPGLGQSCATLREVFCSGEALPYELQERFFGLLPCRLHNLYGPTEAAVDVTYWECRRGDARAVVPIGRPVANTRMHVLDSALRPLPVGVPGELYIGGVQLARGYLNRPELTAERFLEAPGLGRLYRTGDRGRWLSDGVLEYLGRADRQVKLRGFRVELGEIEAALAAHPAVREAAVELREGGDDARLVAYVAPDLERSGSNDDGRQSDQVAQWRAVWEGTYGRGGREAAFDTVGWDSSYTGLPIPEEDMREWRDRTVERILALRPSRVVEVGCGSGLLLFAVAPHCRSYTGIDFSEQAIRRLREQLARMEPPLSSVDLRQGTADDLADLPAGEFDTAILNSVIQYFPDVEYLLNVLEGVVRLVRPGGRVFVGDVRNLGLLEAFHSTAQLHTAPDSLPVGRFRERVRRKAAQERELLIDPAFFPALTRRFPSVGRVEMQVKRGRRDNEMTAFRYDIVLHVGGPAAPTLEPTWTEYEGSGLTLASLRRLLAEDRPGTFAVAGVPNARIPAIGKTLDRPPADVETVGDLRRPLNEVPAAPAFDPEDLYTLGESLSYAVEIRCSATGQEEGRLDVLFHRVTAAGVSPAVVSFPPGPADRREWRDYGNDPLRGQAVHALPPRLRDFLKERLPEYMVPSAFVVLDALPLSPNGKLDRKALPAPDLDRPDWQGAYTPPRTPTEELLAPIWAEVLGVTRVGVHDNFFDLGGHSLQAVQLAGRIAKALGRPVPVKALFLHPTVASLAAAGDDGADAAPDPARNGQAGATVPLEKTLLASPAPFLTIERRPMGPLFEAGELAPVQAAAVGYLPTAWLEYTGLSQRDVIDGWCRGRPVVSGVYETPLGRIALMLVPRFDSQLYQDPEDLVGCLGQALRTAGRCGAGVVSLTGLLPSATNYGQALAQSVAGQDLPRITTGHATTTAAVVLAVRGILEAAGRDLAQERVGFVGLGSVGASTLRALLRCLPHPAGISLCDVYAKRDALVELRRELIEELGYDGPVQILEARGGVPAALYKSSLLVGATNAPDILDVCQMAPGTLIVDDSSPHCFRPALAIRRQRERRDILFTEGGTLRAATPLRQTIYLPEGLEQIMKAPADLFANYDPHHITGCVLSGLLSARRAELPPTVGLVGLTNCLDHYQALERLGFRAADLHCEGYRPNEDLVQSFRRVFGRPA